MSNVRKSFDRDYLITLWWALHPRFKFIKTLIPNAKLLDVGAGPGGLIYWKQYIYDRSDIKFFAVDLHKGELFEMYDDYQICDLEKEELKWPDNFFDAAFLSHVIEHLSDPSNLLANLNRKLKRDFALIYVEFPSYHSTIIPSFDFLKNDKLNDSMRTTINFYDDGTHVTLYTTDSLKALFGKYHFYAIEEGYIINPYCEDTFLRLGIEFSDRELFTYGLWSKTIFAQYIIFVRGSNSKNLYQILNEIIKTSEEE